MSPSTRVRFPVTDATALSTLRSASASAFTDVRACSSSSPHAVAGPTGRGLVIGLRPPDPGQLGADRAELLVEVLDLPAQPPLRRVGVVGGRVQPAPRVRVVSARNSDLVMEDEDLHVLG